MATKMSCGRHQSTRILMLLAGGCDGRLSVKSGSAYRNKKLFLEENIIENGEKNCVNEIILCVPRVGSPKLDLQTLHPNLFKRCHNSLSAAPPPEVLGFAKL